MKNDNRPTAVDLFCGAGGLSVGLEQAGFNVRAGLDNNRHALLTFAENHPRAAALNEDVASTSGKRILQAAGLQKVDLVAGGPSCQGFSTHGKRIQDDQRNFLFSEFVRLVGEMQPKLFVMENVKGLLAYSKGAFRDLIVRAFEEVGYKTIATTLIATDYGVPQRRERVVFMGARDTRTQIHVPEKTNGDADLLLPPVTTVADAISDLPPLEQDYRREAWPYQGDPHTPYQAYLREGASESVTLHQAKPLSEQAAQIARFVGQGEGLRAVPTEYLPARFKGRQGRQGQVLQSSTPGN